MSSRLMWSLFILLVAVMPGESAPVPKQPADSTQEADDAKVDALPPFAFVRLGSLRGRFPFRNGSGAVSLSIRADGKQVFTSAGDGCRVWRIPSGNMSAWSTDQTNVIAAAFARDGQTYFTSESERPEVDPLNPFRTVCRIRQRDVVTHKVRGEVSIETDALRPGYDAFSSDGSLYFHVSQSKQALTIWDSATGKTVWTSDHRVGYVQPFCVSRDNKILVTLGQDGALRAIDLRAEKELCVIKPDVDPKEAPYYFWGPALSPDGKTLVCATRDSMRVYRAATGELRKEIANVRGRGTFSGDGAFLAVGDRNGIRLFDTKTFSELRRFERPGGFIAQLAFTADNTRLISGEEYTLGIWDVETGKLLNPRQGHDAQIHSLAFSADCTRVASGSEDGAALIWSLAPTGETRLQHRLPGHVPAASALAFHPDGQTLATGEGLPNAGNGSSEAKIRLWRLSDGQLVRDWIGHLNSVDSLAFSPDGKSLASGGYDARARLWDPESGKRRTQIRLNDGHYSVDFDVDGKNVLVNCGRGPLALWRTDNAQQTRLLFQPLNFGVISTATVLAGGNQVAAVESLRSQGFVNDARLHVWNIGTGKEERSFLLNDVRGYFDNAGTAAAISRDGRWVATTTMFSAKPPMIHLWDGETGRLQMLLLGGGDNLSAFSFSPDGKFLATAGQDTTVLLWDLSRIRRQGQWLALAGDKAEADAASKALAADAKNTLPFLIENLRAAAASEKTHAKDIDELGNLQVAARDRAIRQLTTDATAEFALRLAIEHHPVAEVKNHAVKILEAIHARGEESSRLVEKLRGRQSGEPVEILMKLGNIAEPAIKQMATKRPGFGKFVPPEQALAERALKPSNLSYELPPRAVLRAVALLADIGTPAARMVLQELADGPNESRITGEAREVLKR